MAGAAAEDGNHPFFVDGNEDECVHGAEDGDGAGWDEEMWAEFSVHDEGLADEEGGELGEGNGESYGGGPHW